MQTVTAVQKVPNSWVISEMLVIFVLSLFLICSSFWKFISEFGPPVPSRFGFPLSWKSKLPNFHRFALTLIPCTHNGSVQLEKDLMKFQ